MLLLVGKQLPDNFDKDYFSTLIKLNLKKIDALIKDSSPIGYGAHEILNEYDEQWLVQTIKILRLTKTQSLMLEKYFKGKKIRNPDFSYPNISTFRPENKFERNQIFKKICEELTA